VKDIEDSIKYIRERIARAAARAGRAETNVLLVGVTKRVEKELIKKAASLGVHDFGENYIQEARQKIEDFGREVRWHMIGHIQTNKLKYIPKYFDCVHSIDRWELAEGLDRYEKPMNILFELNLSGEISKHGAGVDDLKRMLENVRTLKHITPVGLMTMAPYGDDPEEARPVFSRLREILHGVNKEFGLSMTELSMGMSSDFDVAIEEGATMVRVGTALFGERS
jgi:pyridoxal phosphate enzyme (YggS family)